MFVDEGSGGAIPWTSLDGRGSAEFKTKEAGLRIVVILTCSLSVIGSLLIILSYACFKQLRSKPREILMHISLMDFGVSLANLIGAAVYFDDYYNIPDEHDSNSSLVPGSLTPAHPIMINRELNSVTSESDRTFSATRTIEGLCATQAFFAGYFTLGSILWTIFLSIYIYLFLLYHQTKPKLPHYSVFTSYLVSYGVPVIIMLWLVLTDRLGYAPYNSSGWCSLTIQNPSTGKADYYAAVFGNDLWIYLALFLIPILYLASRDYIHKYLDSGSRKQCRNLVYKFLFIPVLFLVLRIWTCVLLILYTYVGLQEKQVPQLINKILLYLSGIGDSGQGVANAILFVLFSRKVRSKFWRCLRCRREVVDITSATNAVNITPDESQILEESNRRQSTTFNSADDTSHLLYRSLDNNSLLVEFDSVISKANSRIT